MSGSFFDHIRAHEKLYLFVLVGQLEERTGVTRGSYARAEEDVSV